MTGLTSSGRRPGGDHYILVGLARRVKFEEFQPKALASLAKAKGPVKALILPTGSGKTRVALQYAKKRLGSSSVAYIVESNHLARQVVREGDRLGIPCKFIPGKTAIKDPNWPEQRRQLLEDYDFGEHIGVFTYRGYFLGSGVPRAQLLIIDDAHALMADDLSFAAVVLKREWDERRFERVLQIISEANPALVQRIDSLDLPVHRGGEAVLVPPLGPETREDIEAVIQQFAGSQGYETKLLGERIAATPHFSRLPLVVTRDTIAWQPFLMPFRSLGENPSASAVEKEILLVTATAGPPGFLQTRLGLDSEPSIGTVKDVPEMGTRLILHYPELYTGPNVNHSQAQTILKMAQTFGSVLVTSLSGHVQQQLADRIGDQVTIVNYAGLGPDPLAEYKAIKQPKALLLVNRPSGVDIPSGLCRVGIHLDLPYSSSGHERVARDVAGTGTALEASLAIRLTQMMGRLNRSPDDRSVHILLTSEPPMGRGSIFARTLEPAVLLDLFVGRKVRRTVGGWPHEEALLAAVNDFLGGKGKLRDENLAFAQSKRDDWTREPIAGYVPGHGDLVTANRNMALGNWQQAFKDFYKFGVDAAGKNDSEAAAFYYFQALCAMDGSGLPGTELLPPGGRSQLVDQALHASPSNPAVLAAFHQAKMPGKVVSAVREADLAQIRRQALYGYDALVAEDERVPAGNKALDPKEWTRFWTEAFHEKDHEALKRNFALAMGVLGSGTPAKGAGDNDLLLRWTGTAPATGLAVEVKGRQDAKGVDESDVQVENVEQSATNAQEVKSQADVALLFTSKSKLEKGCDQVARDRAVRILTATEAPQFAAQLAAQCVALAQIRARQGSLVDLPMTVVDFHAWLKSLPGGRVVPVPTKAKPA